MTPPRSSIAALRLLASLQAVAHGFLQPQITYSSPPLPYSSAITTTSLSPTCRFMSSSSPDDDEDSIDPNSLGDWRAFRMNLANTGLSSSSSSTSTSIDGIDLQESEESSTTSAVATSASTSSSSASARPKSVSKQNELLLNTQNAALAEEYLTGVWAHESAVPEVGGLVCRMPLEAEIYRGDSDSVVSKKLRSLLESDEFGEDDDSSLPSSLSSSASTGGSAAAYVRATSTSSGIIERSEEDSAITRENDDDDDDTNSAFSALAAKTVFWYRGAEKLLKNELAAIMANASSNGRIDADKLGDDSLELLQLYVDHQDTWQEVCLVVEKDEKTGSSKTLTINRPMAFKLSKSLGRLVLFGAYQTQEGGGAVNYQEGNGIETQNIVKFLSAFENECAVYVGGPNDMDKPAVLIHGIQDLAGAVEISPGTGIYRGGIEAAMDGVLSGKYQALDFRFFIGHASYVGGELDEAVGAGKYQPIACSRPLVLKQCLQLPKPLWHEVLEFCGGELKEISKLELAKRDDLMQ